MNNNNGKNEFELIKGEKTTCINQQIVLTDFEQKQINVDNTFSLFIKQSRKNNNYITVVSIYVINPFRSIFENIIFNPDVFEFVSIDLESTNQINLNFVFPDQTCLKYYLHIPFKFILKNGEKES